MHELGIAAEAYRLSRARLADPDRERLARVLLAVGELSAVEPELLQFAWDAVIAGGPDEGCELRVEWCPATQTCPACGVIEDRVAGSWLRLCPKCERPLRVEGGEQLDLLRVEPGPAPAGATKETS